MGGRLHLFLGGELFYSGSMILPVIGFLWFSCDPNCRIFLLLRRPTESFRKVVLFDFGAPVSLIRRYFSG